MKKALKIGGSAIIVFLIAFVGGAFLLPSEVSLERSIVIDAPPKTVYPYVNSFTGFNKWSPWAKIDPETTYEFSGPESGVGARMEWTSEHPNVGSGAQEITSAVIDERVESSLEFEGQPPSKAVFVLDGRDDGKTEVTWEFHGDMGNNPIGRWMGLAMDGFLGPDYEKGLQNLKDVVESG